MIFVLGHKFSYTGPVYKTTVSPVNVAATDVDTVCYKPKGAVYNTLATFYNASSVSLATVLSYAKAPEIYSIDYAMYGITSYNRKFLPQETSSGLMLAQGYKPSSNPASRLSLYIAIIDLGEEKEFDRLFFGLHREGVGTSASYVAIYGWIGDTWTLLQSGIQTRYDTETSNINMVSLSTQTARYFMVIPYNNFYVSSSAYSMLYLDKFFVGNSQETIDTTIVDRAVLVRSNVPAYDQAVDNMASYLTLTVGETGIDTDTDLLMSSKTLPNSKMLTLDASQIKFGV